MCICVLLDFIAINVSFSDSSYTVKEHEGSVKISMFLDKPSPCCLHVLVKFMDDKRPAAGELHVVHIHICIVKQLTDVCMYVKDVSKLKFCYFCYYNYRHMYMHNI